MAYLFIIISTILLTVFNLFSRSSLSKTNHEFAYTVIWQLASAFIALLFLPFSTFTIGLNGNGIILFLVSIIFWGVADAFLFSAYKYEEASVLSAVFPFNYAIAFLTSVLLFKSHLSIVTITGFLCILFTSFFISFYKSNLKPSKGILFGFISACFTGLAIACNAAIVNKFSIPFYMFIAFLVPAIFNFFIFFRPKIEQVTYEIKVQWKIIVFNAFIIDLSYFFFLKSVEKGSIPQIIAIAATSTILTAIGGIFFLKEKKNISIKLLMALLATVGVILAQM